MKKELTILSIMKKEKCSYQEAEARNNQRKTLSEFFHE